MILEWLVAGAVPINALLRACSTSCTTSGTGIRCLKRSQMHSVAWRCTKDNAGRLARPTCCSISVRSTRGGRQSCRTGSAGPRHSLGLLCRLGAGALRASCLAFSAALCRCIRLSTYIGPGCTTYKHVFWIWLCEGPACFAANLGGKFETFCKVLQM